MLKLITGAGHHVYADKPNEFNEYVQHILQLLDENEEAVGQECINESSCSSSIPKCQDAEH
jgi:hypothetical protein